ncbi:MAG: tetratricopeptide repeat protein, partial [bacterium]|nr:tetratricopeptide repeat protein [bacterium]
EKRWSDFLKIPSANKQQKKEPAKDKLTLAIEHYERGVQFERDGKREEAITAYKKANDLSPRPAAYYRLGLIYAAQAEYPTAITNFEKALELVPTFEAAKKGLDRIKSLPR